jgi:hypothetical protein
MLDPGCARGSGNRSGCLSLDVNSQPSEEEADDHNQYVAAPSLSKNFVGAVVRRKAHRCQCSEAKGGRRVVPSLVNGCPPPALRQFVQIAGIAGVLRWWRWGSQPHRVSKIKELRHIHLSVIPLG